MPALTPSGGGLGVLAILEELQVGGVAGAVARLGIDLVHGVVDGHGRLAEAGGDEFELAFVVRDVAGGVDAGQVGLEAVVDLDGVALEFETPVPMGPRSGLKPMSESTASTSKVVSSSVRLSKMVRR
jgi:hypothetical protein